MAATCFGEGPTEAVFFWGMGAQEGPLSVLFFCCPCPCLFFVSNGGGRWLFLREHGQFRRKVNFFACFCVAGKVRRVSREVLGGEGRQGADTWTMFFGSVFVFALAPIKGLPLPTAAVALGCESVHENDRGRAPRAPPF